ncbi:PX domain-containing protein [Pycnococcus provasolii]
MASSTLLESPESESAGGGGAGASAAAAASSSSSALADENAVLESMVLNNHADDLALMPTAASSAATTPSGLVSTRSPNAGALTTPPPVSVAVTDPVVDETKKTALGTGAFVTYLISTAGEGVPARALALHGAAQAETGDTEQNGAVQLKVRRRFRDIVTLADVLAKTLRGFAVPPRPEKAAVEGRFGVTSRQFAEERRRDIEAYVRRLVRHPAAGSETSVVWAFLSVRSAELEKDPQWRKSVLLMEDVFLRGGGAQQQELDAQEAAEQLSRSMQALPPPPKQGFGARLMGAAARLGESARNAISRGSFTPGAAGDVPGAPAPRTEDATHNERIKDLANVERQLGLASACAERYLRSLEESSSSSGDFGLSMLRLGKLEETCASKSGRYTDVSVPLRRHAEDCRRAGSASVRSSRVQRYASDQCAIALGALHEHLLLCPSMRSAFQHRSEAIAANDSALMDRTIAKRKLESFENEGAGPAGASTALSGPSHGSFEAAGRATKQVALSNSVDVSERTVIATNAALDVMTARNDEEWSRWQAERSSAMCRMLWMLARVHAETAERSFRVWLGAAEELKEEE